MEEMEILQDREVSREQVLQELAAIGFARATDYLQIDDETLRVKSTGELTGGQGAAIAQVERTSAGLRLKFYDKLKALELLGKSMGLFDGRDASPVPKNNLLAAIRAATQEEVDCSDLPEAQQAPDACHDLVEPAGAAGL